MRIWVLIVVSVFALSGCITDGSPPPIPRARFLRAVEWAENGQWVKADTHVHTKFSDGRHSVADVVAKASEFGCDVIAITDHADRELAAATPEYAAAIRAARGAHPDLVVIAGLEWNVPPYGDDEHATVLVPPSSDEWQLLTLFKARFDDHKRQGSPAELAEEAVRWLERQTQSDGIKPVVIYNHPSRKRADSSRFVSEFLRLRRASEGVIGFSGAPGHQGMDTNGAYKGALKTIDGWDPAVANPGDAWDQLLRQGETVWAARAPSDFHKPGHDYWPGEFSETWLYVPERSTAGVLRAFQAGTFFGVHGHIARDVNLKVDARGLRRPAIAGEEISVPAGLSLSVTVSCSIPDKDWQNKPNRIDQLELIVVSPSDEQLVVSSSESIETDGDHASFTHEMTVSTESIIVRARGRRINAGEPDLLFYTNPVSIRVE